MFLVAMMDDRQSYFILKKCMLPFSFFVQGLKYAKLYAWVTVLATIWGQKTSGSHKINQ